jgi:hypothetical protein
MARDMRLGPGEIIERVESPEGRRWAEAKSVVEDLRIVLELCDLYLAGDEKDDGLGRQAIWMAAVIKYARCFNKAEGRGVRLNYKNTLKNNRDLWGIHEGIMDVRDKYVAHAGKSDSEQYYFRVIRKAPPDNTIVDIGITVTKVSVPLHEFATGLKSLATQALIAAMLQEQDARDRAGKWAKENGRFDPSLPPRPGRG